MHVPYFLSVSVLIVPSRYIISILFISIFASLAYRGQMVLTRRVVASAPSELINPKSRKPT